MCATAKPNQDRIHIDQCKFETLEVANKISRDSPFKSHCMQYSINGTYIIYIHDELIVSQIENNESTLIDSLLAEVLRPVDLNNILNCIPTHGTDTATSPLPLLQGTLQEKNEHTKQSESKKVIGHVFFG